MKEKEIKWEGEREERQEEWGEGSQVRRRKEGKVIIDTITDLHVLITIFINTITGITSVEIATAVNRRSQ